MGKKRGTVFSLNNCLHGHARMSSFDLQHTIFDTIFVEDADIHERVKLVHDLFDRTGSGHWFGK